MGPIFGPRMAKSCLHYSKVLCEIDTKAWKNGLFWLFLPLCMNLDIWANTRTPLHMDGGLDHFFPNSILLDIAKDGFTII